MADRKIAVRMDDITPDMNWENFQFFQNLFREAGIAPLLGIVPDNRDPGLHCGPAREDFYEVMRALADEGYMFAMHGFRHLYTTDRGGMFPLNRNSEFAGLPCDRQREMLRRGRDIMAAGGIRTDIFMAPSHSYDANTLRALRESGFTKITDGFGKRPYLYRGLTFYPISFQTGRSLKARGGAATLVIHANTVTEAEKERYARLFREHRGRLISYAEYLQMAPVRRHIPGRVWEYLLAECKFLLVRLKCRLQGRSAH